MKITLRPIVSVLAIASLIIITSCGGGSDPSPSIEDQQIEKLTATWSVSSVTLDAVDKTADYKTPNFQLVVSGTLGGNSITYSASGRPANGSPWPASSTCTFGSNPENQLTRDSDAVPMTYSISSDGKTLQISFSFSGNPYTRTSNVKGAWVFTFTKP